MEFKIPKKFTLAGQDIKICFTDIIKEEPGTDGLACYNENAIYLTKRNSGGYQNWVFFHELTHHILNQMGEAELRSNEKFVDVFSTFLYQAIKTMR